MKAQSFEKTLVEDFSITLVTYNKTNINSQEIISCRVMIVKDFF